jgi:hypothetical protein
MAGYMSVQLPVEAVVVEYAAPTSEIEAMVTVLARYGVACRPEPTKGYRSGGALPWLIEITLAAPFAAFFTSAATEAGKDAYLAAKDFLHGMARARQRDDRAFGAIYVIDSDRTHLVLPDDTPDTALSALRDLDWSQVRGGYLLWDEERGRWAEIDSEGEHPT